jgi:2-phospho-L-lactate guanylyltransferase
MDGPAAGARDWVVVLPVKRLAVAKTRLTRFAGPRRADLALAFALDTARAALAADGVVALVAVTDEAAAVPELARLGAVVVADEPDAGLNPALRHGAAVAWRERASAGVATLSSDLPALRPAELAAALGLAAAHPAAMVADAEGTGTTMLAATDRTAFAPRFGHRSRAAHRSAGVVELDGPGLASLRRDVDTEVDVHDALRLGLGPRSAAVVAEILAARPDPAPLG